MGRGVVGTSKSSRSFGKSMITSSGSEWICTAGSSTSAIEPSWLIQAAPILPVLWSVALFRAFRMKSGLRLFPVARGWARSSLIFIRSSYGRKKSQDYAGILGKQKVGTFSHARRFAHCVGQPLPNQMVTARKPRPFGKGPGGPFLSTGRAPIRQQRFRRRRLRLRPWRRPAAARLSRWCRRWR